MSTQECDCGAERPRLEMYGPKSWDCPRCGSHYELAQLHRYIVENFSPKREGKSQ